MRSKLWSILGLYAALSACATCYAATFGTVVPVRGSVSDIALDELRGKLYIANFTAGRIEVMNTSDRSLGTPMILSKPPSSIAMSPENRFLVVGYDNNFATQPDKGGFTVFDLSANQRQDVAGGDPVLAVAFGAGSQALIVTTRGLLLLDPLSARTQTVAVNLSLYSMPLPVTFATFPENIIQAAAGVSGDGQVIMILASPTPVASSTTGGTSTPDGAVVIRYRVGETSATAVGYVTTPTLGPRVISVDQHGQNYLAGWGLLNLNSILLAQFPAPTGLLNAGAHAWDYPHNRIFAQIPAAGDGTVLHVVDTDNLTVRERIQLPQNLAGRSVFSRDLQTLYAGSVSGVVVFPIGGFDRAPRVAALQEDVMFQGDACNRSAITQTIDIVDLGGGNVDFNLSLPANTRGIRFSQTAGTTPARVRIEVDPTVFQNAKGTTAIPLTIQSSRAINLPAPVRLLINTRDVNQRGRIVDVPGKITDILADPSRNRAYLLRQDANLVLVYDTNTFQRITAMRTGNTPVGMTITTDQRYLIVGNDNSQIASVFDLETLQPSTPIVFPFGHYPRSVAASNGAMLEIVRSVISMDPPGVVDRIDFAHRVANALPTLGIFKNSVSPEGVLAPSAGGNSILMALPDGNVVLYDATVDTFVSSRKDFGALGGAFAALSDSLFLVDNHLFDPALVPIGDLQNTTGGSSGVALAGGAGLRTTTAGAAGPGTIERLDLGNLQAFHGASTVEAPVLAGTLKTPPIGQIGQTILPFTRSLAVPADQTSILLLTLSGMAVLQPNFDAPTPVPSISSVTNSADFSSAVAPGGLIQVNGAGLAQGPAIASGLPLPFTLGEVCATIGNVALPLFHVSTSEIMAQLPFTVRGDAPLVIRTAGGISDPFTLHIQDFAPAIFRSGHAGDQTGIATVVRGTNNELVTFTNPIHPEETISIYLTGMGQTSPPAPLGDAAPADPLAVVATPPVVTLGGVTLPVRFAGLAPGEVGVYQIEATVPRGIPDSPQSALVITQGAFSTTLQVRVVNP